MIELLIIAAAWWLTAPDRVTASARTATGTAAKAAGTGARDHWRAGRQGRELARTKRRDRWGGHAKGVTPKAWQRRLLKLEHAGAIGWRALTGTGRLTRAAVKPVPGAVKDGWAKGRERHRERAGDRPVGLALDPPWWRRGTGPEQSQDRCSWTVTPHALSLVGVQKACGRPVTDGVFCAEHAAQAQSTPCLTCGQMLGCNHVCGARGTGPEQATGTGDPGVEQRPEPPSPPAGFRYVPSITGDGRGHFTWDLPWPDEDPFTDTDGPEPAPPGAPLPQDVTGIWERLQQAAPPTDQTTRTSEGVGMRGIDLRDQRARPVLSTFDWDDDEAGDAVMARARDYEALIPEVLLREARRCPHQTACGHKGVTSVEFCGRPSKPGNPYGECARHERDGVEEYGRDGYLAAARRNQDPPAGTSPAGVTTPPIEGDPVPSYTTTANVPSVELNDLDSVRRFTEYVASLGEDSEFMQIVEQCKAFRESYREGGFGGHMDTAGTAFEETAAQLATVGAEFAEQARQVAGLAADVAGG